MSFLDHHGTHDPDRHRASIESAGEDQVRAHFLMAYQVQRGDHVLVQLLSHYGCKPRPAPGGDVELDFRLLGQLGQLGQRQERAGWTALLIGAAIRGDRAGMRMVEAMVRHRLAT